ncbi:uncharacterized protein LOC144706152 [Wolffia australiana]
MSRHPVAVLACQVVCLRRLQFKGSFFLDIYRAHLQCFDDSRTLLKMINLFQWLILLVAVWLMMKNGDKYRTKKTAGSDKQADLRSSCKAPTYMGAMILVKCRTLLDGMNNPSPCHPSFCVSPLLFIVDFP